MLDNIRDARFLTGSGVQTHGTERFLMPERPASMSATVWAMVQQRQRLSRDIPRATETVKELKQAFKDLGMQCDAEAMNLSRMHADLEEVNCWLAANGVT